MYKKSEIQSSKDNGIPRQTLRRHLKKVHEGEGVEKRLGRKTVLTSELEEQLEDVILDMESKLFGLTQLDVRRYVYTFCEQNKIKHNFNRQTQTAGKEWLSGFLKRHPGISMRIPEPTSIQRAVGFNKAKVDRFMNLLEGVLYRDNVQVIPAGNIFNVDESGYTICHKPSKILAKKGKEGSSCTHKC